MKIHDFRHKFRIIKTIHATVSLSLGVSVKSLLFIDTKKSLFVFLLYPPRVVQLVYACHANSCNVSKRWFKYDLLSKLTIFAHYISLVALRRRLFDLLDYGKKEGSQANVDGSWPCTNKTESCILQASQLKRKEIVRHLRRGQKRRHL